MKATHWEIDALFPSSGETKEVPDDKFKGSQYELIFECESYSSHNLFHLEMKWKGTLIKDTLCALLAKCIFYDCTYTMVKVDV